MECLANKIVVIGLHKFFSKMELAMLVKIYLIVTNLHQVYNTVKGFSTIKFLQINNSKIYKIIFRKKFLWLEQIHINSLFYHMINIFLDFKQQGSDLYILMKYYIIKNLEMMLTPFWAQ
jgi:hypothetical protein